MQIPASQARAVLRDEVQQVRLPMSHARPVKGRRVAVKAATGGEALCHARIVSTAVQLLSETTLADVRAEGFKDMGRWIDSWVRWRDHDWVMANVDGFEQDPEFNGIDVRVVDRFNQRWKRKPSFVLVIERDKLEPARFLAASPPTWQTASPDGDDYVSSPARALRGEMAAVSEAEQEQITKNASRTFASFKAQEQALRAAEREQDSLGRRLDQALAAARADGRATSGDVRVIEKRIQQIERLADRRAA